MRLPLPASQHTARFLHSAHTRALLLPTAQDLVCAPRPLNVSYGKEKLKFLGGTSEEAEKNAKVRRSRFWRCVSPPPPF